MYGNISTYTRFLFSSLCLKQIITPHEINLPISFRLFSNQNKSNREYEPSGELE